MRCLRCLNLILRCRAGALLVAMAVLLAAGAPVRGVDADLEWVEVEVALSPDGKAMVRYHIAWDVRRGDMGGFYFQGEQAAIRWHQPGCAAIVDGTRRYDLELRNLGDRWDVLLAGGQRYGPGQIIWIITYFTDYAAAGHVATTTSPDEGAMVVFNWAPVQWDEALDHETVMVRWPIVVGQPELGLVEVSDLGLRTEPFVNERYKLSYLGRPGSGVTPAPGQAAVADDAGGDLHLVVRAHQDRVAANAKLLVRSWPICSWRQTSRSSRWCGAS